MVIIANILYTSLNDILGDVADHMHEVMKKNEEKYSQVADPVGTADILGISSVMVQDMTGKMFVASYPPYGYRPNTNAISLIESTTIPSTWMP
jgi:arginyl-tRNA synthetase